MLLEQVFSLLPLLKQHRYWLTVVVRVTHGILELIFSQNNCGIKVGWCISDVQTSGNQTGHKTLFGLRNLTFGLGGSYFYNFLIRATVLEISRALLFSLFMCIPAQYVYPGPKNIHGYVSSFWLVKLMARCPPILYVGMISETCSGQLLFIAITCALQLLVSNLIENICRYCSYLQLQIGGECFRYEG